MSENEEIEGGFDAFVYLPGNDYEASTCSAFLTKLADSLGKRVIFVQLMENKSSNYSYNQLEPRHYADYIAKTIGKPGKYVMMGISMGCLHIANFAHFYPAWCYPVMFMFEPTIMQGIYPLLYAYEDERGNGEWLEKLKESPNNLHIPANEKVMDMSIDKTYNIPSNITIGIVYTTKSNTEEPYTERQLAAKEKYYHWLSRTHETEMLRLNTSHCVDTKPKYFDTLINFISQVLSKHG